MRINMKRTEIVAKTEELVTPIIEEVRTGIFVYMRIRKAALTLMTAY